MTDWALLLATALAGGILARGWEGWRPLPREEPDARWDLAIMAALAVGGWVFLSAVHRGFNPEWVPYGHDNHDYLQCLVALWFDEPSVWVAFRYPLYPLLGEAWAAVSGHTLYRAGMEVSLACSAAVPVGVYWMGRSMAARPVALAGAILALHLCTGTDMLGTPSAYPLAVATFAFAFGTLNFALRDGGVLRHALAGIALAAYVTTTSKALPLLLLAVGGVGLAQLAARRLDRRALVAFFAPLGVSWLGMSSLHLRLHTLEASVYDVQTQWGFIDRSLPFPDVGWTAEQELLDKGYWVWGEIRGILHLGDVLHYLLFPPVHPVPLAERFAVFLPPMATDLGFAPYGILIVVACLGAVGVWSSATLRGRAIVATGVAVLVALSHVWGLGGIPYSSRWVLSVLQTTPVLLLALVAWAGREAPSRRAWIAWAPLLLALVWVVGPSPGTFGRKVLSERTREWRAAKPHPIAAANQLRPLLQPEDALLDATETYLGRALFQGVQFERGYVVSLDNGNYRYRAPASPASRRWVVVECVDRENVLKDTPWIEVYAWFWRESARFAPVARCIYEDRRPDEPIDTHPSLPQ